MATTYSRISNGAIVESHVSKNIIDNRGHPLEWYVEEVFYAKAPKTKYQYHQEKLTYLNGIVYVSYDVVDYTLEEVLNLFVFADYDAKLMAGETPEYPTIQSVDQEVFLHVKTLIEERASKQLLDIVKTKGYDSMLSCMMYASVSSVPSYVADGKRATKLNDDTWQQLIAYQQQVFQGGVPIPRTWDDIKPYLPELTW